ELHRLFAGGHNQKEAPGSLVTQEQIFRAYRRGIRSMQFSLYTGEYSRMLYALVCKTIGIHEGEKFLFIHCGIWISA
ncbi:MAG TPA: hypothetical protein VFY66_19130, partial [Anaerolineales bacterium]|nr:hypothetical protein [Anaerolineales bacterium]